MHASDAKVFDIIASMHRVVAILVAVIVCIAASHGAPATPVAMPATQASMQFMKAGEGPGPTMEGPVIHLLSGTSEHEINSFALSASADRPVRSVELAMTLRMDDASEGLGILLLDADVAGHDAGLQTLDQWEEPNRRDAIGIGLDAQDPPTDDPYGPNGNIYDRPQREASVHDNGREILNRQSADFATGSDVPVLLRLVFVPGGAKLTLKIAGQAIYDDELLPGVRPFTPRVAIGARTGPKSKLDIAGLKVTCGEPAGDAFGKPTRVTLFDKTVVSLATDREPRAIVNLDAIPQQVGRVIATFALDAPPAGNMDKRDCRGALYIHAADGQRYEVFRFKTPFSKPWEWKVDVTDFLPLMRGGQQTFGLYIDTWREGGFQTTVTLDFYPGVPEREPIKVVNLWIGEPILGDPSQPIAAFFDTKTVIAPPGATSAHARLTVTGHGRALNVTRDAEFLALWRELIVNGQTIPAKKTEWPGLLRKTDNYLNPCRPQRDAWKEDRAGWGPGQIVMPWVVDLSSFLRTTRELTLDYRVQDYVNNHIGKGDPPTYWVDGQMIFYRDPPTPMPATRPASDSK